ncbi:beta-ketoacyl-[acyl-carrier-protein] synthase family protein [Xiashengella succiniciproducens]|uniref:3-oxoacyl-[acyl-carrier-protein] synthase 1 n=1 Tax=Xiashengella succiniciproducens TaxID=2949635 RepID=A0A9J6ZPC0_9BACT|nr:beta-ketoacyl-[acyl-carrier-protein] synthase family protein [Alkaliflexus sp. Ai-910]URW79374.1 beta-ketoacyl-[acyl-carrier-protein] synthase family protein [Alkaliflexus sp. Ai-910]
MKRVVISGIGIYSTIGTDIESVTKSLYEGRSGIGIDERRKEFGFRSCLTGILERPNLKGHLSRRERVGLPEQGEYAYAATMEALKIAGLDPDFFKENEAGILYGNDSSSIPVIEAIDIMREKRDTSLIGSGSIFQSMNSTISMNLSVILKLRGINLTISGACASSSHAIGLAYLLISHGYQDMIICGGGQEINAESMGSFDGLAAFSTYEDDPHKASRPFDKTRNGLVPSGGAATLVVESLESAIRRGAKIYAEIKGYGFSSNGTHLSVPSVEGPRESLIRALKAADMKPSDIDYINAHATSTPLGDLNEGKAILEVFGDSNTPVSSTKSMTGHEMWMGGASEIIYSILMMENSFIAPNINFNEPDEDLARLNIVPETRETKLDTVLSNSFGFGGTNSTLIITKFNK